MHTRDEMAAPVLRIEGIPKPISKIGLGTWQFGSREWGYGDDYARREAHNIVRRALDLGVTLFDTAELYAWGESERILGRAIGERREEAFLATKLFPFFPVEPFASVVRRHGRASARRLGVGRVDLYQLHLPNPVVRIEKTMRGMRDLQEEGVISEVGVSNFDLGGWKAAERALGSRIISNQVQYSLVSRHPERELIPWAEANGRMVIAHSPLAQGVLTGKYHGGYETRGGFLGTISPLFLPENLERSRPLIDTLREVTAGHAAEGATPAQVALAWAIRSPVVVAIPGASSVAQLESNVAAAHLKLADDEVAALSAAADSFEPVPIGALRQTRAVAGALARGVVDSLARRMRRAS